MGRWPLACLATSQRSWPVRLLLRAFQRLVVGGGDKRAKFAEFLAAGSGGAEYESDLALGCDVGGEVGYGDILAMAFGG